MRLIHILIAVFVSAAVAYLVYNQISGPSQQPANTSGGLVRTVQPEIKEVPTVDIYVARRPIQIGEIIDQEMIDRQPWPKHLIGPGFVQASDEAPRLLGMVARAPFQQNEVLLENKLANPEDPSFIAASLPEGMRAVTISVDPVTGLAGFVYPGDRVDVLITHELLTKGQAGIPQDEEDDKPTTLKDEKKTTEMLVTDVRVLAVNQLAIITGEEKPRDRVPSSVTLEVNQADAQRLRLGERKGELSLALRSLYDDKAEFVRPTAEDDLTRAKPPGYFPELYGFDEEFTSDMIKKKKEENKSKAVVTVVRGVEVNELEFERNE